jgi:hypothetical protein
MSSYLVAPLFPERLKHQRSFEAPGTANYTISMGDYSSPPPFTSLEFYVPARLTDEDRIVRIKGDVVLRGAEVHIANQLEASLNVEPDKPVVGLDIGGGARLSWLRLAKAFKREVATGKLVLAATNLEDYYEHISGSEEDEDAYFALDEEMGEYVPSIQTTFSDIPDQSIPLLDGGSIPIEGNVAFAHERCSLTTWSLIPEVDLVGMGRVMTPDGVFMVWTNKDWNTLDNANAFDAAKSRGVEIAHRVLRQEYGFTMTDRVTTPDGAAPSSRYTVFRGPEVADTPLVAVS